MKLRSSKIPIVIFAMLIILQPALLRSEPVLATETAKPGAANPIESSVNELLTVRDNTSLSETKKLVKELEIRKKILNEVLSLSLDETNKLAAKINNLPVFAADSREKELRDEFKAVLEIFIAYYTEQFKKLAEFTKIDETKKLAQEIKDYRDNIYNPQIKKLASFLLLFYNEDVLKVANIRLDKISADIKKLEKRGYIKAGIFTSKLKLAAEILSAAETLLEEAKNAVLNPPEPEELILETRETIEKEEQSLIEPNKLVEDSLNKVKSVYDIFLQVSKSLRKLLGIE